MTSNNFRYRVSPPIDLNDDQLATLKAVMETFIAPLPKDQEDILVAKLKNTHTEEQVRSFCRLSSTSLESIETTRNFINRTVLPEKRKELAMVISVLSTRAGTFALTGHFNEFKNLSIAEREHVVLNWKSSFIAQLRLLYRTFHSLACHPIYSSYAAELGVSIKFNPKLDAQYEKLPERLTMISPDDIEKDAIFDAIIIGSGAGGGVVASQLALAGKSVLVIEKGSYHHESEFIRDEATGLTNLYEHGGIAISTEGSVSIFAGSVFGGGTTINWCASLKLQHYVREEWAKQGLTHFISPKFASDLDRVFERIGASTEGIVHNNSNQVLIDGCKALGYHIADIPQNTNGLGHHQCEFCFAGCKAGIKNGTMNTWLRDAYENNAKFMEKTKVNKVIIKNGKATGVECISNDRKFTIKANQVVVSAGSLQSPGVLLRSGLKNKNIGRNLRLHPATVTFGFFDRPIRTFEGSFMTAVSNVSESVKNDGYGAKLEVPCLPPGSYGAVIPWRGAAHHKDLMLRYDHCSPILVLARDKDSTGVVRYDENDNCVVDYNLSSRDRESITDGMVRSLNVLVAAGARELHTPQLGVEPFLFKEGEESRVDNKNYIDWRSKVLKYGFPREGAGIVCAHQMGSNRMGISPKVSVTKPTGETWEVKDLFVADGSLFPTASGVNPMVTIEAIALHVADSILKNESKL